jgi:hypothetical protein
MTVGNGGEEPGVDKGLVKPPRAKIKEIQFLRPLVGPGDVERQNRQVRSLTMRRVRKEQQWGPRSSSQPRRENEERETAIQTGSSRVNARASTARTRRHEILFAEVKLGSVDPFQTTAMDPSARNSRLLHHCGF